MTPEPLTQSQYVQQRLIKGERINPIQCNREHKIASLSAVISTLKKNGWDISDRRVMAVNGMGEKVTVNEYWMEVKKEPREWTAQPIEP